MSEFDRCESNYAVTHFIAEFANTASSLAMVLAGILGISLHPWAEKRFHLAFLATVSREFIWWCARISLTLSMILPSGSRIRCFSRNFVQIRTGTG